MNNNDANTFVDKNNEGAMPAPQRGSGSNDAPHIGVPDLSDAKGTAGAVGRPVGASGTLIASGSYQTNPNGDLNNGASDENRSAQFKNPNAKQSVDPLQEQYNG